MSEREEGQGWSDVREGGGAGLVRGQAEEQSEMMKVKFGESICQVIGGSRERERVGSPVVFFHHLPNLPLATSLCHPPVPREAQRKR